MHQVLLFYAACRTLRWEKCFSSPVAPLNSIVAGCNVANHMARIILHEVLRFASLQHPTCKPRQYVDDIAQRTEGDEEDIALEMPSAAVALGARLKAAQLDISEKTVIISSSPVLALKVQDALARIGVKAKIRKSGRDLGIDNAAGKTRHIATHLQRYKAAGRRVGKIKSVAKAGRKDTKFFSASVLSKAAYGQFAFGIPPYRRQALRTAALEAATLSRKGACCTTTLALRKPRSDPGVETQVAHIKEWSALWRGLPLEQQVGVTTAWTEITARQAADPKNKWNVVKEPISAVCALLGDLGVAR